MKEENMSFFRNMANISAGLDAYRDSMNVGNPNYDPLGGEFNCFTNPVLRPTFDPFPGSIFGSNCCMSGQRINPFALPPMPQIPINGFVPQTNFFNQNFQLPDMFGIEQQALYLEPTNNGSYDMSLPISDTGIGFNDFGMQQMPSFDIPDNFFNIDFDYENNKTNNNKTIRNKPKSFFSALGFTESSGNYKVQNSSGYLGKYQMGESALISCGYYKKSPDNSAKNTYNNDWTGIWTGKDGVYSKRDYLNNKEAQENAMMIYKRQQWTTLKNKGALNYIGKTIKGIKVTESGLLGAAHLGGASGVSKFLRTNGSYNPPDINGKRMSDYLKEFSGYDVSSITQIPKSEFSA